jgi:hypothetical protein
MPEAETPAIAQQPAAEPPAAPVADVALHDACARLGGIYSSEPDGGQACRVPANGTVVVHPGISVEVKASAVDDE